MAINKRFLMVAYLAGYLSCLASFGIFLALNASRTSLLAIAVYAAGHHFRYYSKLNSELMSVMIVSLVLALPFVLVPLLLLQRRRAVRLIGWTCAVVLGLITLYWGSVRPELLDPAPRAEQR